MPLHIMVGSGFLVRNHHIHRVAATALVEPASIVFTATTAMRRSVPARVEPGLKPNQPNARMKVPSMTKGMLWAGIGLMLPFLLYLPKRGPISHAKMNPITPPCICTTEEPAKSTCPWPRPKLVPSWASQPPPQTQLPKSGYMIVPMHTP